MDKNLICKLSVVRLREKYKAFPPSVTHWSVRKPFAVSSQPT